MSADNLMMIIKMFLYVDIVKFLLTHQRTGGF